MSEVFAEGQEQIQDGNRTPNLSFRVAWLLSRCTGDINSGWELRLSEEDTPCTSCHSSTVRINQTYSWLVIYVIWSTIIETAEMSAIFWDRLKPYHPLLLAPRYRLSARLLLTWNSETAGYFVYSVVHPMQHFWFVWVYFGRYGTCFFIVELVYMTQMTLVVVTVLQKISISVLLFIIICSSG